MNAAEPGSAGQLSAQWLEERFAEAAYCETTHIGGTELRALLDLAAQAKAYRISGLQQLSACCHQPDVEVSGTDMRLLLMLARQAEKRRSLRNP